MADEETILTYNSSTCPLCGSEAKATSSDETMILQSEWTTPHQNPGGQEYLRLHLQKTGALPALLATRHENDEDVDNPRTLCIALHYACVQLFDKLQPCGWHKVWRFLQRIIYDVEMQRTDLPTALYIRKLSAGICDSECRVLTVLPPTGTTEQLNECTYFDRSEKAGWRLCSNVYHSWRECYEVNRLAQRIRATFQGSEIIRVMALAAVSSSHEEEDS
jgi:hypothetical protein